MPTKTELIQMIGSIIETIGMPDEMREQSMKALKDKYKHHSEVELQVEYIKTIIQYLMAQVNLETDPKEE